MDATLPGKGLPRAAARGQIGPNAITRMAEALTRRQGAIGAHLIFEAAGLLHHLRQPPEHMVDEADVRQLYGVVRASLGPVVAGEVAREAGRRTAAYLLARRIPKPLQTLLRCMPAALAARVLLAAIRRKAWTFVGSGCFSAEAGRPWLLHIRGNPLCTGLLAGAPACDFYAATFEGLFRALVHRDAQVVEVACEACGDAECRFEIRW